MYLGYRSCLCFYDFSIGFRNFSDSVVFFVNTFCLTSLPDWSSNRSIHADQFAIPVLQFLNQFYNSEFQSIKLMLE